MMTQPELGKKIAELRKAKGLTQEELVEKCNLSVRTLQRIESGEVTPRSYTIRLILSALDVDIHEVVEHQPEAFSRTGLVFSNWPGQFYRYVFQLFNFKTNAMKKITILAITLSLIIAGVFLMSTDSIAQKAEKAVKAIEIAQNKGNRWMNEGKVDSVLTLYRSDAHVFPLLQGKAEIRQMLQSAVDGGYKMIDFHTISVSVADSIAVQKSENTYELAGVTYRQKGMTEWRLTRGKWLTVNDIMNNY